MLKLRDEIGRQTTPGSFINQEVGLEEMSLCTVGELKCDSRVKYVSLLALVPFDPLGSGLAIADGAVYLVTYLVIRVISGNQIDYMAYRESRH